MARTVLTVQQIVRSGLNPSLVSGDAANGHSFDNEGQNVFLVVDNADASSMTVTILNPSQVDGEDVPDKTVSVPAGEQRWIGPFPKTIYEQEDVDAAVERSILIDLSSDTSLTIGAVQLPDPSY